MTTTQTVQCQATQCDERAEVVTARSGRYSHWCESHAYREVGKVGVMVVRRLSA